MLKRRHRPLVVLLLPSEFSPDDPVDDGECGVHLGTLLLQRGVHGGVNVAAECMRMTYGLMHGGEVSTERAEGPAHDLAGVGDGGG